MMPSIGPTRTLLRNCSILFVLLVTGCAGLPSSGPDFRSVIERSGDAVLTVNTPNGGTATAFALRDSDLVVTTAHSIPQGAKTVEFAAQTGSEPFQVEVIHRDDTLDIALLEPGEPPEIDGLELAQGATAPGTWVVALGNPFGMGITASVGIVGAAPGSIAPETGLEDLIQTDAAINPGNSGGPLLTLDGQVAGMATRSIGNAGSLGFAVPAAEIRAVISSVERQDSDAEGSP